MASLRPAFNGYYFDDYGFISSEVTISSQFDTDLQRSVAADRGTASESSMGPRLIQLDGTLHGSDNADMLTKWEQLLSKLRGQDRAKKGKLDLYGNGHYFAQLSGAVPVRGLPGAGASAWSLQFAADDPYRRKDTITSLSFALSSPGSLTATISIGVDFDSTAWRVPIVIRPASTITWQKNDVFRCYNQTTGARFEHIVTQNLASGEALVVDGELAEVYEKGSLAQEGTIGQVLYLRGGVTNVLDFTGTTVARLGTYVVEFWDRYLI